MQARASLRQVIYDFLSLYEELRKETRKSVANQLKFALERAAGLATGHEPVDTSLDKIVSEITAEVQTAKTFDDFYKLVFKLREKAELAQSLKIYKGDESILRGTLHALASIIICSLIEEEKEIFYRKIIELEDLVIKIDMYGDSCLTVKQGKGTIECIKNLDSVVLELAQLGEIKYIKKAMQFKLLSNLTIPSITELKELGCATTAKHELPIQLQREYGEWFYAHTYQKIITNIDFERFKENASHKSRENSPQKSEEKSTQSKEINQAKKEAETMTSEESHSQKKISVLSTEQVDSPLIIPSPSAAPIPQASILDVSVFKPENKPGKKTESKELKTFGLGQ